MNDIQDFSIQLPDAQWITAKNAPERNSVIRLRKRIVLEKPPKSLKLLITAECHYLLYVNGVFIHRGPIRGTCSLQYVHEIDIAPWLHAGENWLAAVVHSDGKDTFTASPGTATPALLLKCGDWVSDTTWEAQVAREWKNPEIFFTLQTGFREERDLRMAPQDAEWTLGADHADWPPAIPITPFRPKQLRLCSIPPLAERVVLPADVPLCAALNFQGPQPQDVLNPWIEEAQWTPTNAIVENLASLMTAEPCCVVRPGTPVAIMLDFGQDYTFFPELELDSEAAGVQVALTYGEALRKDNRLAIRLQYIDRYTFTDIYTLREGRNAIGSALTERGGRYLQIVIWNNTAPVTIRKALWREHRYAMADRGQFHCSDPVLNDIWKLCVETLHVNMTDIFTDCPWREHAFWVNDLVVENRTSLAAFGPLEIHRRAFEMAFSEQRQDGWVPGVCPAPQTPDRHLVLPATNLFLFEMLWDYYMCSGDLATVKRHMGGLKRILEAVEAERDADGLVGAPVGAWNFYDWGYCFTDVDFRDQRESMFNSLYCQALAIYADLLALLEPQTDPAPFLQRRRQVADALRRRFTDASTGLFADPYRYHLPHENAPATVGRMITQLGTAIALQAKTFPEGAESRFAEALDNPSYRMPDLYLHCYVLRQMRRHGMVPQALARIRKYWGRILADGAKTLYENGIAKFGNDLGEYGSNGSLCHGFGSTPLEFLQAAVLGIEPLAPGFAEFRCAPTSADLQFAKGQVPTPHGNIHIAWEKTTEGLRVSLRIPQGTAAVLPDGTRLGEGLHNDLIIKD